MQTSIGEKIRQRRIALNMTQNEIGEILGVAGATVTRYETGNIKNLKYETITKLAIALKCTPAYLMNWEEKEPANNGKLKSEVEDLFSDLSSEKQQQALNFLRFLQGKQDNI